MLIVQTLMSVLNKIIYIYVEFDLHHGSTNTRPDAFKNPVVVDNKNDINNIIKNYPMRN